MVKQILVFFGLCVVCAGYSQNRKIITVKDSTATVINENELKVGAADSLGSLPASAYQRPADEVVVGGGVGLGLNSYAALKYFSGQFVVPAGSALLPAIISGANTTTGIFFPSNAIGFSNSGVESARFLSDGRLTIGNAGGITGAKVAITATATNLANSYGIYATNVVINNTSGTNNAYGFYGYLNDSRNESGASGMENLYAFRAEAGLSSAANTLGYGTITGFYANVGFASTFGSGTTTNIVGLQVDVRQQSANHSASNMYGVRVEEVGTTLNVTNNWGLYLNSGKKNYFKGNLLLGTSTEFASTIRNSLAVTGGTTAYGIRMDGNINEDVTTAAHIYNTNAVLPISDARTLTNLYHYSAVQGTIGTGNILSNQTAFNAGSSLIGASNNFGFKSDLTQVSTKNITTIERVSNYVKVTATSHLLKKGMTVLVAAVTNTGINGTFIVDSVFSANTFGYTQTGSDITSTSETGTIQQVNTWGVYTNTAPNRIGGNTLFSATALNSDKIAAPIHVYNSSASNVEQIRLQNIGTAAAGRGVSIGFFPNATSQLIGARISGINGTVTTNGELLFETGAIGSISERFRIGASNVQLTGATFDYNSNRGLRLSNGILSTDAINKSQLDSALTAISTKYDSTDIFFQQSDTLNRLVVVGNSFGTNYSESDAAKTLVALTKARLGLQGTTQNFAVNNTFVTQLPTASVPSVTPSNGWNDVALMMYAHNEIGYFSTNQDTAAMKTQIRTGIQTLINKGYQKNRILVTSPSYIAQGGWNIYISTGQSQANLNDTRTRLIYRIWKEACIEKGVRFVDIYTCTAQDTTLLLDGLHLNYRGAQTVAAQIAAAFRGVNTATNIEQGSPLILTNTGEIKVMKDGLVPSIKADTIPPSGSYGFILGKSGNLLRLNASSVTSGNPISLSINSSNACIGQTYTFIVYGWNQNTVGFNVPSNWKYPDGNQFLGSPNSATNAWFSVTTIFDGTNFIVTSYYSN